MIGISLQVQGGGVDFHSAALLHDWMKDANENDEWDEQPTLALLVSDGDNAGVVLAQFSIAADFQVKPWMVLREVAAVLLKQTAKQRLPTTAVAVSFFCEAWTYRVPSTVMDDEGLVAEDWKEHADPQRRETKTIMTLAVDNPEENFYSDRYRETELGWFNAAHVHADGTVDLAMREVVNYLARKNEGGDNHT